MADRRQSAHTTPPNEPIAMIPRLIHQTCPDKGALPPEIQHNIGRLQTLNPGWRYQLYDDEDVSQFISKHFDETISAAYRRINPRYGAARADLFRYLLVWQLGGVYLDLKSTVTVPLDSVLQHSDRYLIAQWPNRLGEAFQGWGQQHELPFMPGGEFQQWHVAAEPRHEFLRNVIAQVLKNVRTYSCCR
jgi:mannosyltransferase OCH1-like enzyme